MKKIFLIFIAMLISVQAVQAISLDVKEIYQPKETLIAEITGNILEPIAPEDVELKRVNVQIPWEYDVKRIDERYFIYGILPDDENNYILYINDIATTVNGQVESLDFQQNLSISGELISYNIKPGFVITQEDEFSFDLFLNRDFGEPITVDFPEEHEFILNPGDNTLTFSSLDFESGLTIIQIGIYTVPVMVNKNQIKDVILIESPLRFFPIEIESTILFGKEQSFPVRIINVGEEKLIDLSLEFNPTYFTVVPNFPNSLGPEEDFEFEIILNSFEEDFSEIIVARIGDDIVELPVNIMYTEEQDNVILPDFIDEDFSQSQGYYCSELGGESCSSGELCSGDNVNSLDVVNCCIGSCSEPESESSSLAWVGWLVGVVVLIVLVIVAGRYLKAKKMKKDPLKEKLGLSNVPSKDPAISSSDQKI